MKILVLGGAGMLGHQLVESWRDRHDVHASYRLPASEYGHVARFLAPVPHFELDVLDQNKLAALIGSVGPDAVINAVGVVKQRRQDPIPTIATNALFPHQLAALCAVHGARLVHLSTDCVFSGARGGYREDDLPDPVDLYGRTKLVGEVTAAGAITLRTSMIGLELACGLGLVAWFLAQRGTVAGYERAIFSGLTTLELSRVIETVLVLRPKLTGVYHVAANPTDKLALLTGLRDRLGLDVAIAPDRSFVCDRSLDGSRFREAVDYSPPSWPSMLDELATQIRRGR
jgi:dTDP-4-dehydrorhamnose reductase